MVRVAGSRFVPADGYTVKVEGARRVGYRTVSIAGARDPIFIAQIDEILAAVRDRVADNFAHIPAADYRLLFHVYGKNAVMGPLEPHGEPGHELGIVIEAVAGTQELANTICAFARSTMLHHGYRRPDLHGRQPRLPVLPVGLQGRRGLPIQPLPPAPGRRPECALSR